MRDCCFCGQIEGRRENDLIADLLPYGPYLRRVVVETECFAVIPSLGPLAPGHVLLCPKDHVKSFAQLDAHLEDEHRRVHAALKARLRAEYGHDVTVFEHGMAISGEHIPCTVEHAHRHFVPLPSTIDLGIERDSSWVALTGTLSSLRRLSQGREYLYFEGRDGRARFLPGAADPFPSQHMRRIVASGLNGAAHWDWRAAPDARAADETWRRLAHPRPGLREAPWLTRAS